MAQKPPFVLKGDQLAALTFWHGAILNDWANQWVDYWTDGKGEFVSSGMEDTRHLLVSILARADWQGRHRSIASAANGEQLHDATARRDSGRKFAR